MAELEAGWGWPRNSKKAHYFPKGQTRSICGKWAYGGGRGEFSASEGVGQCAGCRNKKANHEGKKNGG